MIDDQRIMLAAPLPPGAVMCVGLYDPATLARLEVQPSAGYEVKENVACQPLRR